MSDILQICHEVKLTEVCPRRPSPARHPNRARHSSSSFSHHMFNNMFTTLRFPHLRARDSQSDGTRQFHPYALLANTEAWSLHSGKLKRARVVLRQSMIAFIIRDIVRGVCFTRVVAHAPGVL